MEDVAYCVEPARTRATAGALHQVKQKHLTQVQATGRLKVTDRQVRRLLSALEERMDVP